MEKPIARVMGTEKFRPRNLWMNLDDKQKMSRVQPRR